MMTPDPGRLVFVAGLHRSGTTPLTRTLGDHPAISRLRETHVLEDEGQHLQDVYPPAMAYGGPGRFAFDEHAHLTEGSALARPENAARLWDSWSPYWDLAKPFLVEKSPPNLVMGRFLQALFPGSALIVVMRHPVVVALSTAKWRRIWSRHPTKHASIETMIEHWLVAHRILRDDLPHLGRVHVLRYEDLVRDPTAELQLVQRFLGLETPFPANDLTTTRSRSYEVAWEAMQTGGPLRRRRRRRIEERFSDQVAEFGYDVAELCALAALPGWASDRRTV